MQPNWADLIGQQQNFDQEGLICEYVKENFSSLHWCHSTAIIATVICSSNSHSENSQFQRSKFKKILISIVFSFYWHFVATLITLKVFLFFENKFQPSSPNSQSENSQLQRSKFFLKTTLISIVFLILLALCCNFIHFKSVFIFENKFQPSSNHAEFRLKFSILDHCGIGNLVVKLNVCIFFLSLHQHMTMLNCYSHANLKITFFFF